MDKSEVLRLARRVRYHLDLSQAIADAEAGDRRALSYLRGIISSLPALTLNEDGPCVGWGEEWEVK